MMSIKRRDFVSGFGLGLAGLTLNPWQAVASGLLDPAALGADYYPPALTGLRGSHAGSFEAAHALAMEGRQWPLPQQPSEDAYDLVVVGAGLSGLAAAWFFRERAGNAARILLLDNHDDFGGHAKRNEFTVDGRRLIGYGGSQNIDTPSSYSAEASRLLRALGIETKRFETYNDRGFTHDHGLGSRWYFDKAHYGVDRLVENPLGADWVGAPAPTDLEAALRQIPIQRAAQNAFLMLLTSTRDWLAGHSVADKLTMLRQQSYDAFLRDVAGMPQAVVDLLTRSSEGLWGVGYDAISALEATRLGMPGTAHLGVAETFGPSHGSGVDEPYIFHFPDGNAGIARLLVRSLVPETAAGQTMEDIETARLNYAALDDAAHRVRIRLNATAIDVRHAEGGAAVDVCYLQAGAVTRVRAAQVVLACYNHVLPHICPELPADQVEALRWPQKVPLVYTNVALRNWQACQRAGMYHFEAPADFFGYGMLDFPVSMPDYRFSSGPDQPILMHLAHLPNAPGLPAREQYRQGRARLLGMSFADYEARLRSQLGGMLGAYGFDFDRDVAGITVNRWPHGYAYEYVDLFDPPDWGHEKGPHILGRRALGRITIANSDSQADAYVDGAFDAAWRAVGELQSVQS